MSADGRPSYTPFAVSVLRGADEAAVGPRGELDLASVDELTQEVEDLWAAGSRRVLIDLTALEFIDSSGLRSLLDLREAAASDGHELALRSGPSVVQRIFELTGTAQLFDWR